MLIARTATLALLVGTLPLQPASAQGATIAARLCDGSSIAIPLGDDEEPQPPVPCPAKACHAGTCRKQIDRSQ